MDQAQFQQVRQNNHFEGEVQHWLEFVRFVAALVGKKYFANSHRQLLSSITIDLVKNR